MSQSYEVTRNDAKLESVPLNLDFTHENVNLDRKNTGFSIQNRDFEDRNQLDAVARKYGYKLVGEHQNIKTAICCIASKDLPKDYRFSLILVNPSSTGKSYFLNTILEPLRETKDVLDFTDFSEAFFKRSYDNVNGKIIKVEQLERRDEKGQLNFHKIKHLLSEGILKFGNVDQDENGQRKAKEFEVRGIPVFLTTATDSNIDRETENRFLVMELDESEEQTEQIIKFTLDNYSSLIKNESWNKTVKELTEFFKELKKTSVMVEGVLIPFADKIFNILPKNLEIRRDLKKILNLTCVIAFINWKNRDRLQNQKPEHLLTSQWCDTEEIHKGIIIAKPEDFKEALEIAGNSIKRTINKTNHKTMELFAKLKKLSNEKGSDDPGITIKELVNENWPETTVRDYLKTLRDNGFVIKDENGKEHKFYPIDKKISELKKIDIEFSKEEYIDWLKQTLTNSTHFFVPSRDSEIPQDLFVNHTDQGAKTQSVSFREVEKT